MKTSDIAQHLAPRLNFLLSRKCRDWRLLGLDIADPYPETLKHPTDVVSHFLGSLDPIRPYPITIATFSDSLINVTGQLVRTGYLRTEEAKVFLIGEDDEVTVATFDANGMLVNWPYGWFLPDQSVVDTFLREHATSIS